VAEPAPVAEPVAVPVAVEGELELGVSVAPLVVLLLPAGLPGHDVAANEDNVDNGPTRTVHCEAKEVICAMFSEYQTNTSLVQLEYSDRNSLGIRVTTSQAPVTVVGIAARAVRSSEGGSGTSVRSAAADKHSVGTSVPETPVLVAAVLVAAVLVVGTLVVGTLVVWRAARLGMKAAAEEARAATVTAVLASIVTEQMTGGGCGPEESEVKARVPACSARE